MKSHPVLGSYLRLFHAFPTTQSFDVYLDEKKYAKDLLYEDFTVYKALTPGEHQLTICTHRTLDPVYERSVWISEHRIYTLVLAYLPDGSKMQGYLLNDPPKPIPEEHLLIRTANFSQHTSPITLHLEDIKPIFKKIPLRQTSPYLSFIPATAPIELADVTSQESLLTLPEHTFKITRYYTLYLIGGIENYPLKLIQTIDGNSFLHFEENKN